MTDSAICGICRQRPATIHVILAGPAPGAAVRQAHICGSCCDRLRLDPVDHPEGVFEALAPPPTPLKEVPPAQAGPASSAARSTSS